jgi:hypothetical protein
MVSQAFTDGDMETMETSTHPWTKSHEAWHFEKPGLGVCEYKKGLLAYSQEPYIDQISHQ